MISSRQVAKRTVALYGRGTAFLYSVVVITRLALNIDFFFFFKSFKESEIKGWFGEIVC